MAMDNPSYFTIPKCEQFSCDGVNSFENQENGTMGTSSSSLTSQRNGHSFNHLNGFNIKTNNLKLQMTPEKSRRYNNHLLNTQTSSVQNDYLIPNEGTSSPHGKRQFRSLLRSLSANAASSNDAQSILLGEPRPADIAPPNHSDPFSLRNNKRFTHGRNIHSPLRSCTEIKANEFHQAMLRRRAEVKATSDVFHTMPGAGRRRHSIGEYLTRERLAGKTLVKVTSVPSDVPLMDPPQIRPDGKVVCSPSPVSSLTRRRNPVTTLHCTEIPSLHSSQPATQNTNTSSRKRRPRHQSMKEMENIVLLSCKESPEAELWSDYLISCFNKIMAQRARQNYKVSALTIEDMTTNLIDNPKIKHVATGKLQIIIICPRMLDHVAELSNEALEALNVFDAEKVLVMQLGVSDESVTDVHKKAFLTYDQWERMVVKEQDNTFVDNFLGKAVDILSKKLLKPPSDKATFSIIPKKIKPFPVAISCPQDLYIYYVFMDIRIDLNTGSGSKLGKGFHDGQNRVIALLNDPISSNDTINIQVDKKGEILQIHSFKRRNPYTLQFDVPDCCLEVSMLVWIKIEKNGTSCGSRQIKCESRLRELDQILRASDNPLEFMCQTLGFKTTDKDQLDSWMLTAFQKNIPPHFNLLAMPQAGKIATPSGVGVEEYPTLLHFAARYGLERLSWQLLECPGGEAACATRNNRQQTPADLAQQHGFTQLASTLRGYMQMNEFSNMYYYLKNMSEETTEQTSNLQNNVKILNTDTGTPDSWTKFNITKATPINSPDSVRSDPFSDECLHNLENKHQKNQIKTPESPKVPSSPKHSTNEWLYENDVCQMNTSISSTSSLQKAIEHDYLIQPSNRKVETIELSIPNRPRAIDLNVTKRSNSACEFSSPGTPYKLPPEFFEIKSGFNNILISKNKHKSQDHITNVTGQDELAEIINDFKNNVFTITEVEKLVMEWRNRNETQQSLKEKQDQLNKMREEYDKLQKRIKDDMKRPTPFERVKKMFSKGKSKSSKNGTAETTNGNNQRPNSGLSLHSISSSSSGRLSTASGGSLGDSGTQSDNEDAKILMELKTPKSPNKTERFILEDYLIPPPPRPLSVGLQRTTQFTGKHQPLPPIPMDTINEREPLQETSFATNRYVNTDMPDHQYMNMSPA